MSSTPAAHRLPVEILAIIIEEMCPLVFSDQELWFQLRPVCILCRDAVERLATANSLFQRALCTRQETQALGKSRGYLAECLVDIWLYRKDMIMFRRVETSWILHHVDRESGKAFFVQYLPRWKREVMLQKEDEEIRILTRLAKGVQTRRSDLCEYISVVKCGLDITPERGTCMLDAGGLVDATWVKETEGDTEEVFSLVLDWRRLWGVKCGVERLMERGSAIGNYRMAGFHPARSRDQAES